MAAHSTPFTATMLLLAAFLAQQTTAVDVAVDSSSSALSDSQDVWTPEQARAAVFSEPKERFPKDKATQAVEFLRFISAYSQGVEALVDITPYSALMRAMADDQGEIDFYAFIDTWVGNNTDVTKPIVSMKSQNGTCQPSTRSEHSWGYGITDGNGYQIDINLVFWPQPVGFVDTRPRESVTVSSGWYGSYGIGQITVNEGTLIHSGSAVQLEPSYDPTSAVEAEVYPCAQGKSDVENGVKMGKLAKRAHQEKNDTSSLKSLEGDLYKELENQAIDFVKIISSDAAKMEVNVEYDPKKMTVVAGMPVFYEASDIDLKNLRAESPMMSNWSAEEESKIERAHPVGKVITAGDGKAIVKMSAHCVPTELSKWLPRLRMPKSPDALERAQSLANSIATAVEGKGLVPVTVDDEYQAESLQLLQDGAHHEHFFKPFLVCPQGKAFKPMRNIGRLALNFSNAMGEKCEPNHLAFIQKDSVVQKHADSEAKVASTVERSASKSSPMPLPNFLGGHTNPSQAFGAAKAMVDGSPKTGTFAASNDLMRAAKATASGSSSKPIALPGLSEGLKDGDKVCVLTRRATGRVFERSFAMPDLTEDDSVLYQFSSTGHGWSGSTEQCGEFCHAIYHININGKKAMDVTQWRDDCSDNPISNQYGTWTTPRNGWCPGSVEPGLYVDVSKFMKGGNNQITVDVDVWSGRDQKYEPYTNYGGFFGRDPSNLFIGSSFFVYDKVAVDAIKKQGHQFTAAEKALVNGCNQPEALKPPKEARPDFGMFLELGATQQSLTTEALEKIRSKEGPSTAPTKKSEVTKVNLLQQGSSRKRAEAYLQESEHRYDFEKKGVAPWYLYNEAQDGPPGKRDGAQVLKLFSDNLIQINSREIFSSVKLADLPMNWAQAALHLRLETPVKASEDYEIDHWDRLGSTGMLLKTSTQKVQVHPAKTPTESKISNLVL